MGIAAAHQSEGPIIRGKEMNHTRKPNRAVKGPIYQVGPGEKIVALVGCSVVLGLGCYLVIRNEPFRDPNLVIVVRMLLSLAVAVLGATIPGFLQVDFSNRGVVIRGGGALALFVITFLLTPSVLLPVHDSERNEKVIERVYRFKGPIKISHDNGVMTFALTDAVRDDSFSMQKVRVEQVIVTGKVAQESEMPFGFDQELLFYSESLPPRSGMSGTDPIKFEEIEIGYVRQRALARLVVRTDDNRTQPQIIRWKVESSNRSTNAHELKELRDGFIEARNGGMFVQLFVWTKWGGNHFIEFKDFEVKLRIRSYPLVKVGKTVSTRNIAHRKPDLANLSSRPRDQFASSRPAASVRICSNGDCLR